jgi:hypothetical protein
MKVLRSRIVLTLGLGVILIGVLASFAQARSRSSCQTYQPRSLVGASSKDVAQQAINYTCAFFYVYGSTEVRQVRTVTDADLPSFGLPEIGFSGEEPPLMLVILQGDFDVRNMPGTRNIDPAKWHARVEYIAYVFDLRDGGPTLIKPSWRGSELQKLLNDPTLPQDSPKSERADLSRAPTLIPGRALPTSSVKPQYGTIAPGVLGPAYTPGSTPQVFPTILSTVTPIPPLIASPPIPLTSVPITTAYPAPTIRP